MITVDLPSVNALVEILLEDGTTHPSRVENVEGLVLSVAAPAGVRPQIGSSVAVRWLGERGVYSAPARLVGTVRDRILLWTLESEGVVEFGSRRGAVRVEVDLPVRIVDPIDDSTWEGRLVDLSESGLRCHLAGRRLPKVKLRVRAEFDLDGVGIEVLGAVLRGTAGRGDEPSEVVVVLNAEEKVAQRIRRYVIHRQILARRVRDDASD